MGLFDPGDFTEDVATIQASFVTYKRNGRGGVDVIMTVDEDHKHEAIDMVDGGDIMSLLIVKRIPRDEMQEADGDAYDPYA